MYVSGLLRVKAEFNHVNKNPEFLDIDFKNVKAFPIPVFMLMGRHDYTTPSEPAAQWLKNVKFPFKKGIWFENSSHLIPFEEPGKMVVTLLNDVQPCLKIKESLYFKLKKSHGSIMIVIRTTFRIGHFLITQIGKSTLYIVIC